MELSGMELIVTVEQCVKELVEKFEQDPNFFTHESDIKCYLYHLLVSKENLQGKFTTKNKKETCLVHTEYPSLLRPHVDVVIFDPKSVNEYALKKQRILCAIEIKFWSTAHFDAEQRDIREKLRADKQAYKFLIYLLKKPDWWKEFEEELEKNKEHNEEWFLKSQGKALVTRIKPEIL